MLNSANLTEASPELPPIQIVRHLGVGTQNETDLLVLPFAQSLRFVGHLKGAINSTLSAKFNSPAGWVLWFELKVGIKSLITIFERGITCRIGEFTEDRVSLEVWNCNNTGQCLELDVQVTIRETQALPLGHQAGSGTAPAQAPRGVRVIDPQLVLPPKGTYSDTIMAMQESLCPAPGRRRGEGR